MRFTETKLPGVFLVDIDPHEDDRGFFARIWCMREFKEHGLDATLAQCSISLNKKRGTLRGMHYQAEPHAEAKLVRCTKGSMYDVALDLRHDSPTFKQWVAAELSESNRTALFIPKGCAHGFQTLEDDTEVLYMISIDHHPESAKGVRWNDSAFGIDWPIKQLIIADRDRQFPDFP